MAFPSPAINTLQAFLSFVELPQNRERRFEFVDGEVTEVPSNPYVSVIASRIIAFLTIHIMQKKLARHVTGEGGGYVIDGHVFAPDVAVVEDLPTNEGYETVPPLLAVEVLSDPKNNTEQTDLRRKLAHYIRAGITVWVVDYVARQVEVHVPGEAVQLIDEAGSLDGGDILPDLSLSVKDLFPGA
jgi:Uma2 family endonuclease